MNHEGGSKQIIERPIIPIMTLLGSQHKTYQERGTPSAQQARVL